MSRAPDSGLVVENLTCRRGGRQVFANLNTHVPVGARAHLRGPNGSGKSSLLRILAGLSPPAAGAHRFTRPDGAALSGPDLLYVGHQNAVKPWMTVAENLQFWLSYTGSNADPGDVLAAAGLAGMADLPAGYLSFGQTRRLALARIWAEPPDLVLLDEPTVGLDAAARAHLESGLTQLCDQGATLVVATHGEGSVAAEVTIELGEVAA
jgi:heme exporter protein A